MSRLPRAAASDATAMPASAVLLRSPRFLRIAAAALCAWCVCGAPPAARELERPAPGVTALEQRLHARKDDVSAMEALAAALLAQVRIGGGAEDLARAGTLIDRSLVLAPAAARPHALDAWRLLIAHRFAAALAAADTALQFDSGELLGLTSRADALTELGRYGEAESTIQLLLDRHYGIAALARASHLRFLSGDLEGAIELARRAIESSAPGPDRAWLLLDRADLELARGAGAVALALAREAAADLPTAALAMQARAEMRLGAPGTALAHYRDANMRTLRADYLLEIWRLACVLGERDVCSRSERLLEGMARLDDASGGRDARSFAEFRLARDEFAQAEALARRELQGRPDIYSEAQMAWVLYRAGKLAEARPHAERAVAFGTPDARLRWRAGTVLAAAGDVRGAALRAAARAIDPGLDDAEPGLALRH